MDDGSTDKSCEIVKSVNDPHIRLIRQKNGGPSKARNRGIKEAQGKFIAFLDADDEWLPEKLEEQYKFHAENPDVIWSCTAFEAKGGKREESISYSQAGVIDNAWDAIMDGMTIQTSTVVMNKSVFGNDRLFFNESFKRSEDREVWYKMACLYSPIGYIDSKLLIYYVGTEGSLNATGLGEQDFSFLSLNRRIEQELSTLDNRKKQRFLEYLEHLTKERMLTIWGWTNSFEQCSYQFEPHVSSKMIAILKSFNFLPSLIKKVLVKAYLATMGKFR